MGSEQCSTFCFHDLVFHPLPLPMRRLHPQKKGPGNVFHLNSQTPSLWRRAESIPTETALQQSQFLQCPIDHQLHTQSHRPTTISLPLGLPSPHCTPQQSSKDKALHPVVQRYMTPTQVVFVQQCKHLIPSLSKHKAIEVDKTEVRLSLIQYKDLGYYRGRSAHEPSTTETNGFSFKWA